MRDRVFEDEEWPVKATCRGSDKVTGRMRGKYKEMKKKRKMYPSDSCPSPGGWSWSTHHFLRVSSLRFSGIFTGCGVDPRLELLSCYYSCIPL